MAGRPRQFDREEALNKAMRLFWERGYEGTSVGDLADALDIGKPSLYAAFGHKEQLFLETLDLYQSTRGSFAEGSLDAFPTARAAIESVLRRNAEIYVDPSTPSGCFIVLAAVVGSPQNAELRANLAQRRQDSQNLFARRIAQGIADGDVAATADPQAIAAFYITVINGLSLQARDGASRAALDRIVGGAMAAWDPVSRS